ncbi:MAG: zeta toxin family protein [Cytophagales bacterium]|nr:zeta toxin family protein [Cytophagales bacterium]MDW8384404.1 zeta toxin family protein [Flammeovirgaceae bacterium]
MKTNFLYNPKTQQLKIKGLGLRSPLFWGGAIFKILLSTSFASTYLTELFIPFVNYFISSGFENPYTHFYEIGQTEKFPYPAMMLYALVGARSLIPFSLESLSVLDLVLYRIPLLAADFVILIILLRWLSTQRIWVFILYWLSPIIVYINYLHGQLDIIPTAFLFISLYFLFKHYISASIIFLTLGISSKTHLLLALPFYAAYLLTLPEKQKNILKLSLIVPIGFCIINLPFLWEKSFWVTIFLNKEQAKLFDLHYVFTGGLFLYIAPAVIFGLIIQCFSYRFFHKDLFMMFLGFAFGLITVFIPPMPGWYLWVVPFLIYFYLKQIQRANLIFWLLPIFYFLYFGLIPDSDYAKLWVWTTQKSDFTLFAWLKEQHINAERALNLVFTLLQTSLLLNCVIIYRKGVQVNTQYKILYQPFLIGLGGDSGAGKSTLSGLIEDLFGKENTVVVRGDDMHKWERGHEKWREFTHLNPKANLLHNDLRHTLTLKKGEKIQRRHYDHNTGKFTSPIHTQAKRVIIFEGLHPFFLAGMRNAYDLKIFVKPEEQLRQHWKIIRDTKKRGYSREKVMQQIISRQEDAEKYIQSQEKYADIVIMLSNKTPIEDIGNEQIQTDEFLKLKFENLVDVEPILTLLGEIKDFEIKHYYSEKDDYQFLECYGNLNTQTIEELAEKLVPEAQDVQLQPPRWQENYNGFIQVFLLYYIFYKMKLESYELQK